MLVTIKSVNRTIELKALVFDLDGTLLGPGAVLSERTLKAVESCRLKGIEIILATGRAVEASEKYRAPIGAIGPMVYFNGAIVADMPGNKILYTTLLSKEIAEFCFELSRERGVYFQFYVPGTDAKLGQPLLTAGEDAKRDMYHKHTGLLAEICDLKKVLSDSGTKGCIKAMFLGDPNVLDELRPCIEGRFGKDVYVVRSTNTFLEILNPAVSKGAGLDLVLKKRGIKNEEVMVFGDEENDLPMFPNAGLAVCPANAKDTVKEKADFICGSNAEDGVAVFLEQHIVNA